MASFTHCNSHHTGLGTVSRHHEKVQVKHALYTLLNGTLLIGPKAVGIVFTIFMKIKYYTKEDVLHGSDPACRDESGVRVWWEGCA